jgi:hypothetical protein
MGKRSNFQRSEDDFYPTPGAAVVPLIPYLRLHGIRSFAEPCAGEAGRAFWKPSACAVSICGDIRTGQDALAINFYGAIDAVITNPPFSRYSIETLKRMIVHFQHIAPTWLLLPLDFAANEFAAPFLQMCSHIVIIGRVKWFEHTPNTGYENFAWYRFDAQHVGGPVLHNRGNAEIIPSRRTRACEQCGRLYEPKRSSSRFASNSSELFRYIRHADVPRFTAEGWVLPARRRK